MAALTELIDARAGAHGEAPALADSARMPLTFEGLRRQRDAVAASLHEFGIGSGDAVAIVLPNGAEMASAFLTVACSATTAPLNPQYGAKELDFYLDDLRARALIVQAGESPVAREVARKRGIAIVDLIPDAAIAGRFVLSSAARGKPSRPRAAGSDDVAIVLHTSGTTARPKMVPLTHANIRASADQIRASLELTPRDRCLNVMPLFHIHGLVGALLSSVAAGAGVCCTPGFAAADFFERLERSGATWYTAVPTMHRAVVDRAATLGAPPRTALRFIRSCSSALAPSLMEELERLFNVPVVEAYGMTEGSHQIAVNPQPPRARKPGSVGLPIGTEVAVFDAEGHRLASPEVGELVIRGGAVTSGYVANPDANAKAFVDGWFRTGDRGFVDEDGYVFITGRLKEMINRGGENIAPREIDEVLLLHPAVAQCVAFGAPHPTLGEEVAAAVVLREGHERASIDEIQTFVGAHLASFKVPRRIMLVDALPRGATGKLQRVGLAARLGVTFCDGASPEEPYEAPAPGPEATIAAAMAAILKVPRVSATGRFFALGGDSISAAGLVCVLREKLGVPLTLADMYRADSPRTLAAIPPSLRNTTAGAPDPERSVLRFNETGDLAPLFFIHGSHEAAACCAELAARCGPRQPVFVLPGIGTDGSPVPATIEQLAAAYLPMIRAVHAVGGCHLLGYCRSAPVALELARQLAACGERIETLIVVDAEIENTHWLMPALRDAIRAAGRLRGWSEEQRLDRFLAVRRIAERLDGQVTRHAATAARQEAPDLQRDAYVRARRGYVPRRYRGRMVVLRAAQEPFDDRWRKVAASMTYREVPGNHLTCLTADLGAICGEIQRALDGAPPPGPHGPRTQARTAVANR